MLKLYRLSDAVKEYWETWGAADGSHIVHWGALGTRGETKAVQSPASDTIPLEIKKEVQDRVAMGFEQIAMENHAILLIEYQVDGMGVPADLSKRHKLEERMNETLGWTGLGFCDGGSIGSDSMEVCNFVVDFDLAKKVIEQDLAGTEYSDFTKIYAETSRTADQ